MRIRKPHIQIDFPAVYVFEAIAKWSERIQTGATSPTDRARFRAASQDDSASGERATATHGRPVRMPRPALHLPSAGSPPPCDRKPPVDRAKAAGTGPGWREGRGARSSPGPSPRNILQAIRRETGSRCMGFTATLWPIPRRQPAAPQRMRPYPPTRIRVPMTCRSRRGRRAGCWKRVRWDGLGLQRGHRRGGRELGGGSRPRQEAPCGPQPPAGGSRRSVTQARGQAARTAPAAQTPASSCSQVRVFRRKPGATRHGESPTKTHIPLQTRRPAPISGQGVSAGIFAGGAGTGESPRHGGKALDGRRPPPTSSSSPSPAPRVGYLPAGRTMSGRPSIPVQGALGADAPAEFWEPYGVFNKGRSERESCMQQRQYRRSCPLYERAGGTIPIVWSSTPT